MKSSIIPISNFIGIIYLLKTLFYFQFFYFTFFYQSILNKIKCLFWNLLVLNILFIVYKGAINLVLNMLYNFRSDEVAAERLETLHVLAWEGDDGGFSEEVALSYLDEQELDSPNTSPSTPTSGKRTRDETAERASSSSVKIGDIILPITSRSVKRRRFVGSKAARDQVHELDNKMEIEEPKIEPLYS